MPPPQLFAVGPDSAIYRKVMLSARADKWSGWGRLGGSCSSGPAAARDHSGRLVVVAMGPDKSYRMRAPSRAAPAWQVPPNASATSAPTHLLSSEGSDATASAISAQNAPSNAPNASLPAVTTVSPPTPEPSTPVPPAWLSLGGKFASRPALVKDSEGFLHVFGRGADNMLYERCQQPYAAGSRTRVKWGAWSVLGGPISGRRAFPAPIAPSARPSRRPLVA